MRDALVIGTADNAGGRVEGPTHATYPPILAPVESGRWHRAHFCILYDLEYDVGRHGSGDRITVPAGFIIDGASLGRLLAAIFGRYGRHLAATIVHDYLTHTQERSREEADRIFHEYMLVKGVPQRPAWLMWAGVRLFGWWPWWRRAMHRRWYWTRRLPLIGERRRYLVSAQELHYLRFRAREFDRQVRATLVN